MEINESFFRTPHQQIQVCCCVCTYLLCLFFAPCRMRVRYTPKLGLHLKAFWDCTSGNMATPCYLTIGCCPTKFSCARGNRLTFGRTCTLTFRLIRVLDDIQRKMYKYIVICCEYMFI